MEGLPPTPPDRRTLSIIISTPRVKGLDDTRVSQSRVPVSVVLETHVSKNGRLMTSSRMNHQDLLPSKNLQNAVKQSQKLSQQVSELASG